MATHKSLPRRSIHPSYPLPPGSLFTQPSLSDLISDMANSALVCLDLFYFKDILHLPPLTHMGFLDTHSPWKKPTNEQPSSIDVDVSPLPDQSRSIDRNGSILKHNHNSQDLELDPGLQCALDETTEAIYYPNGSWATGPFMGADMLAEPMRVPANSKLQVITEMDSVAKHHCMRVRMLDTGEIGLIYASAVETPLERLARRNRNRIEELVRRDIFTSIMCF